MQLGIPVPRPGKYILVIQYHSTLVDKIQKVDIDIQTQDGSESGGASLQVCPYRFVFWLIWFFNQRAFFNHALSIVGLGIGIILHCRCLCTPPPGTGLDIETSYLVYMCTYVPHVPRCSRKLNL